jgi:alanine dehydrogenase
MYIACHFWDKRAPMIFTAEEVKSPEFKIKMIGDISCDVGGPIPTTLRVSTLTEPFYGYDVHSQAEVPFGTPGSIGVMSVDNLPCDLPRDASVDFGHALIEGVLPHFFNGDPLQVLQRATQTENGQLTPKFAYLQDFVEGKE